MLTAISVKHFLRIIVSYTDKMTLPPPAFRSQGKSSNFRKYSNIGNLSPFAKTGRSARCAVCNLGIIFTTELVRKRLKNHEVCNSALVQAPLRNQFAVVQGLIDVEVVQFSSAISIVTKKTSRMNWLGVYQPPFRNCDK